MVKNAFRPGFPCGWWAPGRAGWSDSSQEAFPQPGSGCSKQHMKVCWLPPATRVSFKATSPLCACMAAQQLDVHQHRVWELGRTPTQQPCHPLLPETGAYSDGLTRRGIGAQLSSLKKRTITALTATRFCCTAEKTPRHPVPSSYDIPLTELKPAMALPTQKGHTRAGKPSLCSSTLLTPWHTGMNQGTRDLVLRAHTARGRIISGFQSYPGAAAQPSNRPGRNNLPHHYAGKICNCKRHQG